MLTSKSNNFARCWRSAIGAPLVHHLAPFFEQVAATVSRLSFVLDHVGKRGLAHLVRKGGALRGPVSERGTKTVNCYPFGFHAPQHHLERHHRQRLALLLTGKYNATMVALVQRPHDLEGAPRQRHPVLAASLHP